MLLSVLCAIVMMVMVWQHNVTRQSLSFLHQQLRQCRAKSQRLRQQSLRGRYRCCYRWERRGLQLVVQALWLSIASSFALAVRSLAGWNGWIVISLGLFLLGLATVLLSVFCLLIAFYWSPTWDAEQSGRVQRAPLRQQSPLKTRSQAAAREPSEDTPPAERIPASTSNLLALPIPNARVRERKLPRRR